MTILRRLRPFAAWLALALVLPAAAAAQDRVLSYRDGLGALAITATDKLKLLIDGSNGARFRVAVLPGRDGDLDVACNPLADALRQDFEQALDRRREALRLDALDLVSRQELGEGDVTLRLEWRPEGDAVRLSVQLARFLETNVARETGGSALVGAEGLPERGRICLAYDATVFARCEVGETVTLDDSPAPAMAEMLAEIPAGAAFRVIAAFDSGRALLVRHRDAGAASEYRGFVPGGVERLRRWQAAGQCHNVRLGGFAEAARQQEPWFEGRSFADDCRGCPRMVVLPDHGFAAGMLGGTGGVALEEVRRLAFAETETTMAEWLACVEAGACPRPEAGRDRARDRPVSVSYAEAAAYAVWLAGETGKPYRLPTEAEWEFAARGGATTRYPWGDVLLADRAVCAGCAAEGVGPGEPDRAGRREPNGFGLYDMQGNLWEWVAACTVPMAEGAPCRDGRRVLKGGSFRDPPLALGPDIRHSAPEGMAHPAIGFRVVRTGPPRR